MRIEGGLGIRTFPDPEVLLALLEGAPCTFDGAPRRVEVLREFGVRWRERVRVQVGDNGGVELRLLHAVHGGVVG